MTDNIKNMIKSKVTKNQVFTLSLEDTVFEKPQGEGGFKLTPLPLFPAVLGLNTIRHIRSLYIQPLRFLLNLGLFIING